MKNHRQRNIYKEELPVLEPLNLPAERLKNLGHLAYKGEDLEGKITVLKHKRVVLYGPEK